MTRVFPSVGVTREISVGVPRTRAARLVLGVLLAAQLAAAPVVAEELVVEPVDAPPPPAPPPAPAPGPLVTARPHEDLVRVDIDANFRDAGLEPAEFGAERCLAPCGKAFPRDGNYRITGEGLIASEVFQLPARSDQVMLDVRAGSTAQKTAGACLGGGGLAMVILGSLYAIDLAASHIDGPPATGAQRTVVFGSILGGAAVSAIGAFLYFTAGTRVRSKGAPLRFGP